MKTFDAAEQFEPLFQYIGDEPDAGKVRAFSGEPDIIGRLEVLRTMAAQDMLTCLQSAASPGGFRHFLDQLVLHRDKLMPRGIDPRDIKIGVIRDALFSAMTDTPEVAIYDEALDLLRDDGGEAPLPPLRGRYSHVNEKQIGFLYPSLRDLYVDAARFCDGEDGEFVSDPVAVGAEWLAGAARYHDPDDRIRNASSLREAVAWSRIPDSVLRERLRTIRRNGGSMRNLRRFIDRPNGIDRLHEAVVLHDSVASTYSPIDWISHAPFSSIHRAYQSLRSGRLPDAVVFSEVANVILGSSRNDEEAVRAVQSLYRKAAHGLSSVKRNLEDMVKVGTILSDAGCPYSFQDVSHIASSQFDGLSHALKVCRLEAVKDHLRQGIRLRDIVRTKEDTRVFSGILDDTVTNALR